MFQRLTTTIVFLVLGRTLEVYLPAGIIRILSDFKVEWLTENNFKNIYNSSLMRMNE